MPCKIRRLYHSVYLTGRRQGWALLCFRVLASTNLVHLHYSALGLLKCVTGGGNPAVLSILVSQLTDTTLCPEEICASSFRRILSNAAHTLKESADRGILGIEMPKADTTNNYTFAAEVLEAIGNMCIGSPASQMYLQSQEGHPDTHNLIEDIVTYVFTIAGILEHSVTVIERSHRLEANNAKSEADNMLDGHAKTVLVHFSRGVDALIGMTTGPLVPNQEALAATDVFAIVSRVLSYSSSYTWFDLISPDNDHSPRRHINLQISKLLSTVMEGAPGIETVSLAVGGFDWSVLHRHLTNLQHILETGSLYDPALESATQCLSAVHRKRGLDWLKKEIFLFVKFTQKMVIYGACTFTCVPLYCSSV